MTADAFGRVQPVDVGCRHCDAPPDEMCTTPSGRPVDDHAVRIRDNAEANAPASAPALIGLLCVDSVGCLLPMGHDGKHDVPATPRAAADA